MRDSNRTKRQPELYPRKRDNIVRVPSRVPRFVNYRACTPSEMEVKANKTHTMLCMCKEFT
eukprot:12930872-Prorocentrum_lima.AAC.1